MKYLDWLWRLPFVWLIKLITMVLAPVIALVMNKAERTDSL